MIFLRERNVDANDGILCENRICKEGILMRNFKYPVLDVKQTGKRIKEACRQRNLSVREIQDYLGLGSFQAIYCWFNGQSLPSLDNMYALSHLLGKPIDSLLVARREPDPADGQALLQYPEATRRLAAYLQYLSSKIA